jgi:hypothetical protein
MTMRGQRLPKFSGLSPHYSLATWQQVYQYKDPALPERWLADLRKAGLK